MPRVAKDLTTVVALFEEHAVGRGIRDLTVHGINSLKSQTPPLASLVGQQIDAVALRDEATFAVGVGVVDIVVDLQRTGSAHFAAQLDHWSYGAGPQPTVRLLLDDGSGIDLKEPSKTKRITVRLIHR